MKLDCNVVVGNWPFRKIRDNTIEKIEKKHQRFGISGGFVSSAEAAFYQDPFEADFDLARALENRPNYRHVITVNPALPGAVPNIHRSMRELNPAGVRIYSHYHDFALHSEQLEAVCDACREYQLPLFLNLRMDDIRSEYMILSHEPSIWDVIGFLERHTDFPIIICNARMYEFDSFCTAISQQDNVCVDVSGFKDAQGKLETICAEGRSKYLVYGSNAPIFAMASTVYLVEKLAIADEHKRHIMSGNALLDRINPKYHPKLS